MEAAEDTDGRNVKSGESEVEAGKSTPSTDMQISLPSLSSALALGSWLVLCILELADDATDEYGLNIDDRRHWSYAVGLALLVVALSMLIAGAVTRGACSKGDCKRQTPLASVVPAEADPWAPVTVPSADSKATSAAGRCDWHRATHGTLLVGALGWIIAHVVLQNYQQAWRGVTTLHCQACLAFIGCVWWPRKQQEVAEVRASLLRLKEELEKARQVEPPSPGKGVKLGSLSNRTRTLSHDGGLSLGIVRVPSKGRNSASLRSSQPQSKPSRWKPLFQESALGSEAPLTSANSMKSTKSMGNAKESAGGGRSSFLFEAQVAPLSQAELPSIVVSGAAADPADASGDYGRQASHASHDSRRSSRSSKSSGFSDVSDSNCGSKSLSSGGQPVLPPAQNLHQSDSFHEDEGFRSNRSSLCSNGSALSDISAAAEEEPAVPDHQNGASGSQSQASASGPSGFALMQVKPKGQLDGDCDVVSLKEESMEST
eukprot:TRINITY_DN10228_c0_g2_i1.p1 TRINITY_DN10228_c0_g2~~TRINITY_DN10228_c0_g2_i1.p1  ORF type:complete len:498 (-),score=98.71 TRINITY_DN10228_c0_g2_i1:29-1489(-)